MALRKASDISLGIISKYHNYILLNISQMLYEYNIYDTVNQSEQSNLRNCILPVTIIERFVELSY